MIKHIHILSGIPGCGKSTLAKKIAEKFDNPVICSADNFFVNADGKYVWDGTKAGAAHSECMAEYLFALADSGCDCVIVDNTNIRKWERQNYLNALLLLPKGSWVITNHEFEVGEHELELCHARCTHGVPMSTIRYMWENREHMYEPVIHTING